MAKKQDLYKEFEELDREIQTLAADSKELVAQTAGTEMVTEQVEPKRVDSPLKAVELPLDKNVAEVIRAAIKEELKNAEILCGEGIFTSFSEKAALFFEQRVKALERTTYGLNKTIESWAGLSRKTICIGVFSAILIGVLTYLITYWIYPPHQLTQKEQVHLLYGQVLSENFEGLAPSDQELLAQKITIKRQQNKK